MTIGASALSIGGTQDALAGSVRRLSSGLRVSSAADDPSGLAIATDLSTQAQGLDQGSRDVGDGIDALAVADGALATVSSLLQRMRALTVQGRSDLLSAEQRAELNGEVAALARAIDATAQDATFNGIALFATPTANAARTRMVTEDDALASGEPLVDPTSLYVDTSNGANLDFTVSITAYDPVSKQVTVQFDASSPSPSQTFDNTFPQSRSLPTAQPSSTWWIDDATHANRLITLTINQVSAADVGKTFNVTTGASAPPAETLSVATGENEGASVDISVAALSQSVLGVQDVAIGTDDAANQTAQESVDRAILAVGAMRAKLGAETVSMGEESADSATASVNFVASESDILDVNVATESTTFAQLRAAVAVRSDLQTALRREALALTGTLLDALR
ncbi:MAG TPA: flagellin [Candidatus Elarobacter sp.]|nr:flagellin [Candidatus Elarobacter sp.]